MAKKGTFNWRLERRKFVKAHNVSFVRNEHTEDASSVEMIPKYNQDSDTCMDQVSFYIEEPIPRSEHSETTVFELSKKDCRAFIKHLQELLDAADVWDKERS